MKCKYCNSDTVVKNGKKNDTQCYKCKDCNHTFLENDNYTKMRVNKQIIVSSIDMFYEGLSVRKIKRQIKTLFGTTISQVAIWKWIQKYSQLVKEYVDTVKLEKLCGEWHLDETMIKCNGENKWVWQMIDNDTKFMLAMHLSDSRTTLDVANVFKQGKDKATEKPKDVYVDGCVSYQSGFNKVLYDHHQSVKLHQKVGIRARKTNNVIERLHVTLKDRTKPMRGLGEMGTAKVLLDGWNVHYNFVRPHQSLKGKTPAEVAGSNIHIENGWKDLIGLAINFKNTPPIDQK
jgi:putative transposase